MFKRGGVWWTCLRIKGRKIQRSLETMDKDLAKSIEAKIRVEIVEGKYFDKPEGNNKTFRQLSERYLEENTINKSIKSQIRDTGIFKNHLNPFFGEFFINDISSKHISKYRTDRKKQGISSDTIIKELGLMKSAFNVAIREWEWLDSNPVNKVRMEKAGKGRVRFLSEEEFDSLYNACEEWMKPIVTVARYTGLRQENLLSLEWKQIDLTRKSITIEHTKNGERLGLPICNRLLDTFTELKKVKHIHTNLVFHNSGGKRYPQRQIGRSFKKACTKSGIENFRWHDLRHDFASQLVQRGVDLFRVQKLLGHKDPRMTQRYAHLSHENLQSAVNALDKPDYNLTTVREKKVEANNATL